MGEADEPKVPIPGALWQAAVIIALQSFSFGYVFSCLNSCLVTGDNNEGSDCFHGEDNSCPEGTMYNDINVSLSKYGATSVQLSTFFVIKSHVYLQSRRRLPPP